MNMTTHALREMVKASLNIILNKKNSYTDYANLGDAGVRLWSKYKANITALMRKVGEGCGNYMVDC